MRPNHYFLSHEGFQSVDFSYPTAMAELFIISSRNIGKNNKVLEGVFDNISYALIALSLILLAFVLYLNDSTKSLDTKQASYLENLLVTFGLLINEPLESNNPKLLNRRTKYFITFISVMFFLITSMYNSIIISILTAKNDVLTIDTLDDLVTKFPGKRIFLLEESTGHNFLRRSPYLEKLESRIDFVTMGDFFSNVEAMEQQYEKVHSGSHVLIDFAWNVDQKYLEKLSPKFVCRFPLEKLRYSRESLTRMTFAYLLRKGFILNDSIDKVGLPILAHRSNAANIEALFVLYFLVVFDENAFPWPIRSLFKGQCQSSKYEKTKRGVWNHLEKR